MINALGTRWQLRDRIDAMAEEFAINAGSIGYTIYVLIDPGLADPSGHYPGTPIYVGETAKPGKRFKSHLARALSKQGSKYSVHQEIYRMACAGRLPMVQVLETCMTRAASLEAETRWAQRLLKQGYKLFNRLPEQSRMVGTAALTQLARKRLWDLTLAEADRSGVTMSIHCPSGCFKTDVNIKFYAGGDFPNRRLAALKRSLKPCACCGGTIRSNFHLGEPRY